MTKNDLKDLLNRVESGTATDNEKALLENWLLQYTENDGLPYQREDILADAAMVWDNINAGKPVAKTKSLWPRIAAAASIILVLSAGGYFLFQKHDTQKQMVAAIERTVPKQAGIVLTLANGKTVEIDRAAQGDIRVADGTHINQKNGELSYGSDAETGHEALIHTLTNNSGNKYSLTLADGTEVYLDAQSSITYPIWFSGKQRRVSVAGQAYFKVRHNAAQQFIVQAKDQMVEDIGTEFNIRAYEGTAVTTLLSGLARVQTLQTGGNVLLKPGEQTLTKGSNLAVQEADTEETTDWLQGKMIFSHRPLGNILADVSRIYGVQFSWQTDDLKAIKLNGAVSRTRELGSILEFFRHTGKVDFQIKDNQVQVIPGN